jgi:hypothetical protein
MNKRRYIAQQGSKTTIKVFVAETGQLFRVIDVGGEITSPPICTETELYVGVRLGADNQVIKYFSLPGFNLKQTISI